jgi:hypothetical protein
LQSNRDGVVMVDICLSNCLRCCVRCWVVVPSLSQINPEGVGMMDIRLRHANLVASISLCYFVFK